LSTTNTEEKLARLKAVLAKVAEGLADCRQTLEAKNHE